MVVVGEGLWSPRSHSQALFLAPFGVQASRAVERAENEARTCLGKVGRMCVAPEQAVERAENEARTCLGKAGRTCVAPEKAVERAEDEARTWPGEGRAGGVWLSRTGSAGPRPPAALPPVLFLSE